MQPCDAVDFLEYEGTRLRKCPGSDACFYVVDRIAIDADGSPNAYHPLDRGIDALGNAGFPNGGWTSILAVDPFDRTKPFVQTAGPFAGFFVSKTTLQDTTRAETDPRRYVDATKMPYLVFPGAFHTLKGTGTMGDVAVVRNLRNGKTSSAIVADVGPLNAPLGEVSIRLAENLGGAKVNPRNGSGAPAGPFLYVLFPRSRATPAWPLAIEAIDQIAHSCLTALGGWDRVRACIPAKFGPS
ncbi:MAG: glycoside hydrolase family 75 protein [Acidobacteriota bacterium]